MKKLSITCLALVLPISLVWACGSDTEGGNGGTGASSTGATMNLGGDVAMTGGDNGTGATLNTGGTMNGTGGTLVGTGGTLIADLCGTEGCACSDGMDNDDDGLSDGLDPECTGPLDNDEGSFATGIPGDNRDPKWQDCFFDGNSGAGDDGCRYATGCLTGDVPADDKDCTLTDECVEFCGARTPNGCDCFGCCTVDLGNGETMDLLTGSGSTCSLDTVDDPEKCPPCTKTDQCGNTCGTCELCPGRTIADLPEECNMGTGGAPGAGGAPGGPGYTCDGGEQVCGPDLPACSLGAYCTLGCCILGDVK